jgi:hypothetical protein
MALAAEAAELLEIFQWLTEEQSKNITESEKDMALIKQEIADVFIYLSRLADTLSETFLHTRDYRPPPELFPHTRLERKRLWLSDLYL